MAKKHSRILGLLALSPLVAGLAACGGDTSSSVTTDDAAGITVAASVYPLEEIVARVGGDKVTVLNLTPAGGAAHDVELSARTLDELSGAAAIFYLGDDFQPAVEDAVAGLGTAVVAVDLLDSVELLEAGEHTDHGHGAEGGKDDHSGDSHSGDDHSGDGHSGEDHGTDTTVVDPTDTTTGADDGAEHAHGTHDPHVWTDPANMAAMARTVAETLADLAPEHADEFAANAATYAREMDSLGADFDAAFETCESTTVVTSHEAFAYLLTRLGLESVTIAGINPDDQPSAQELSEIAEKARDAGVSTIFVDATISERLGRTIADEIGADVAALDPIESVSAADREAGATYETIQRANLTTLATGLGCSQ